MVTINCPGCGNAVKFVNAASIYARCDACDSLIIRRDVNVELLGKVAALQDDQSPLQLGTHGKYDGKPFEVVGRIQIRYDSGFWNEWFIHFQDGRSGWLGEAQGVYFVNFHRPEVKAPERGSLAVGRGMAIDAYDYVVTQLLSGAIVSFEGELPFAAQSGMRAVSADLRGGGPRGVTVDYSDEPMVFIGEYLRFEDLAFTNLRDLTQQDPKRLPVAPTRLDCPNCGAPQQLKNPGVSQLLVCAYCGSGIDTTSPKLHLLWKANQAGQQMQGAIELGARGRLFDVEWECLGHLRKAVTVEYTEYAWHEYLLYNPLRGYRWLVENNGHWSFVEPVHGMPENKAVRLLCGDLPIGSLEYEGRTYRHFQSSVEKVSAVLGEFYWQVREGDLSNTADYVSPPFMLSGEITEGANAEITWSKGTYIDAGMVAAAFGANTGPASKVAPHQPNPVQGTLWAQFSAFLAAALLIMIGFSVTGSRRVFNTQGVYFQDEAEHGKIYTLTLDGHPSNVVVHVNSNVNNRWAYFHMALINEETHEAIDFGQDVSFYSGVDDGEYWSEGSRDSETILPKVPAGNYSLFIDPQTGTGDKPDPNVPTMLPGAPPSRALFGYSIDVDRDVPGWRWFFLIAFVLVVPPIIQGMRYASFEKQRWMESDHPPLTSSSSGDSE